MEFLGLYLSDVPSQNYNNWKVFVIPVLYVFTSLISMKLTTTINKTKEKVEVVEKEDEKSLVKKNDDQQEMMDEMSNQMKIMMPIMTVSIALIAPLGLALYWLVSNLLMIVEKLILNKVLKDEEE